MTAPQLAMLEQQYFERKFLEMGDLPRLSPVLPTLSGSPPEPPDIPGCTILNTLLPVPRVRMSDQSADIYQVTVTNASNPIDNSAVSRATII